jgi:GNAT superfamily N-acetyltransferase
VTTRNRGAVEKRAQRTPDGHTIGWMIEQQDGVVSAQVAEAAMRALPQWFGLEEPLRHYVQAARTLPTFIATENSAGVGFLTLKPQTPVASEIFALGVLREWHRHGIGRALVEAAVQFAQSQGVRLLQVKTLGPSHPSENYARTRVFYESLGFIPMEETTAFWGAANPCLILVKPLA